MSRWPVAIALTLSALASPPRTARAQGAAVPPRARAFYKAGYTDYNVGRFAEALAKFERAAKLTPHPTVILALAQCHRHLDHLRKALFFYRLYQSKVSETARYPDVQEQVRRLERLIAARAAARRKAHAPAHVTLHGLPAGAEVFVDGALRAQAPLGAPLAVAPGRHRVEVRAAGRARWQRTLLARRASAQTLRVELAAAAPRRVVDTTPLPLAPTPRRRSTGWLVAGISTSALAAAAEVTALVLTHQANQQFGDSAEYRGRRDAAIGMHVLAGCAVVGAVISWVLYGRSGAVERAPRVAAMPLLGGAAVRVRF